MTARDAGREGAARPHLRCQRHADGYAVFAGRNQAGTIARYYPPSRIRRGRASTYGRWRATDMAGDSGDFATRAAALEWLAARVGRPEGRDP
jgi:hypothetical protein